MGKVLGYFKGKITGMMSTEDPAISDVYPPHRIWREVLRENGYCGDGVEM